MGDVPHGRVGVAAAQRPYYPVETADVSLAGRAGVHRRGAARRVHGSPAFCAAGPAGRLPDLPHCCLGVGRRGRARGRADSGDEFRVGPRCNRRARGHDARVLHGRRAADLLVGLPGQAIRLAARPRLLRLGGLGHSDQRAGRRRATRLGRRRLSAGEERPRVRGPYAAVQRRAVVPVRGRLVVRAGVVAGRGGVLREADHEGERVAVRGERDGRRRPRPSFLLFRAQPVHGHGAVELLLSAARLFSVSLPRTLGTAGVPVSDSLVRGGLPVLFGLQQQTQRVHSAAVSGRGLAARGVVAGAAAGRNRIAARLRPAHPGSGVRQRGRHRSRHARRGGSGRRLRPARHDPAVPASQGSEQPTLLHQCRIRSLRGVRVLVSRCRRRHVRLDPRAAHTGMGLRIRRAGRLHDEHVPAREPRHPADDRRGTHLSAVHGARRRDGRLETAVLLPLLRQRRAVLRRPPHPVLLALDHPCGAVLRPDLGRRLGTPAPPRRGV